MGILIKLATGAIYDCVSITVSGNDITGGLITSQTGVRLNKYINPTEAQTALQALTLAPNVINTITFATPTLATATWTGTEPEFVKIALFDSTGTRASDSFILSPDSTVPWKTALPALAGGGTYTVRATTNDKDWFVSGSAMPIGGLWYNMTMTLSGSTITVTGVQR